MGRCACCPQVPVVSVQLAQRVLSQIPPKVREAATVKAMEWLVERHEGISLYAGIHGRLYTDKEKDTIALETQEAAALPCPFFLASGCLIGGLGPQYNRVEETAQVPYGWLPTLAARLWALDQYRELVKRSQIADVKVALLRRNEGFLSKDTETGKIYVG